MGVLFPSGFVLSFWYSFSGAETMAFLMKTMISSQVKNLGLGGRSEEKKEEGGTSDRSKKPQAQNLVASVGYIYL